MSDEEIVFSILVYMFGFVVTILSVDDMTAINRRAFLWPAYWLYLSSKSMVEMFEALGGDR